MRAYKLFTLFILSLCSHGVLAQGYEYDVERGEKWRPVINKYGRYCIYGKIRKAIGNGKIILAYSDCQIWIMVMKEPMKIGEMTGGMILGSLGNWDTKGTAGGNNPNYCPSIHSRTDKAPGSGGNPNFTVSKKNAARSVRLLDPDFCPIIAINTCL